MYRPFDRESHQLIITGGISIPTGSTTINRHNHARDNQRLQYMMQTGTGNMGCNAIRYLQWRDK